MPRRKRTLRFHFKSVTECFKLATKPRIRYNHGWEAMQVRKTLAWLVLFVIAAASLSGAAETGGVRIDAVVVEQGDNRVSYPRISGLDNAFVQDSVNARILQQAQPHLDTLAALAAGLGGSLQARYEAWLMPSATGHDLLGILLNAQGKLPTGRSGHLLVPMAFDLANAQEIGAEGFFLDAAQAQGALEAMTEDAFSETLSNYLDVSAMTPLPITRAVPTEEGLLFCYPEGGMTWLSGRAASVFYLYHELAPLLDLSEGSLLDGAGVSGKLKASSESGRLIAQAAEAGRLPGLDAAIGGELDALTEAHRLLYDPEGFPGGEKIQLEDDRYRGTALLTTDGGTVSGLLSRRMNLFGLITGSTTREEARLVLGAPAGTLPLDAAAAELYGLRTGEMDSYRFGSNDLRLAYNQDGTLGAVWLNRSE